MPRIDPLQLLKCLGVLLTPNGGIRSKDEVQRLASLMMKFSKKLVSKCVYILILKNTETDLLGMFMSAGGWTLVLTWLSDGIYGKNWALVTELLELLLMCPVDVERLKSNSIPRLVKGLSKDENLGQVNVLATKLVEQWLKIVKDETVAPEREVSSTVVIVKQQQQEDNFVGVEDEPPAPEAAGEITLNVEPAQLQSEVVISPHQFYKITVRDGKQVIAKVDSVNSVKSAAVVVVNNKIDSSDEMTVAEEVVGAQMNRLAIVSDNSEEPTKENKMKDGGEKRSSKDRSGSKERSSSSSSSSRHRSSSSSSKNRSTSSGSSRDKNNSNSSSSSRDKNRDKDKSRDRTKDKYKHRSNGKHSNNNSSSSSSNNSNSSNNNHSKDKEGGSNCKEKQAEKDKDTLAKIQPKSVEKLGRIPKKSASSDETKAKEKTKSSISIEVRKKDGGERPKTVKVFNSKLRSTGLEEAAKPPPPRPTVKKTTVLAGTLPTKRPSPSREPPPPPEKRIKLPEAAAEPIQEKPGGIKLIPAKPKPAAFLQESDMFMDALAASATNKKEPKKRKRRTSVSKDSNISGNTSPPLSPSVSITGTSPLNSPLALKSITAPKFYKDTLEDDAKPMETEEDKPEVAEAKKEVAAAIDEEEEGPTENIVKEVDGIRGVLVYHKRRGGGPKKNVKWRIESELEEVQYFELDETERVNVTKTFMDMKQMEHTGEREALQMSRKLPNEDLMDERTMWRTLVPIDLKPSLAEHGKKSLEKDIQFAREKVVLQALYFSRSMLPDSGAEPDLEIHQMTDPITIPLDDVTGNPDSVNDFQNTPWPEPKGSPPHVPVLGGGGPPIFPGTMPPFGPQIGPPGFAGIAQPFGGGGPNFISPPNMMGGDWRNMGDGMPHPSDVNHGGGGGGPGPMNANLFNNRGPDGYANNMMDENNVGFPPQGFGPGPMPGPPGPPGPMYPNFPANQRGNQNRGGFRNMGRGGWFRPAGPPPGWHGGNRGGGGGHWGVGGGGGGGRGGGICKQFKMHGYCRQRETCPYMHPQGNAPY